MKILRIGVQNKINKFKYLNKKSLFIPVASTPIVAYYIGESKDKKAQEVIDFFKRKNLKLPNHIKPHADTGAGFNSQTQSSFKKALDDELRKGRITQQEHDKYTKKLIFTGKNNGASSYPESELSIDEHASGLPSVYDEQAISAEMTEINELDNAIEAIDKVLDNPLLIGVAAEVVPFARFIKPAVDLVNGDGAKAFAGVVSRGVDIVLSPIKFMMALTTGATDAIIGSAFNDKNMTFWKGFKGFYNNWAKMRNNTEDEALGRETQEQKLERLRKLKEEKLAERQKKIDELTKLKQDIAENTEIAEPVNKYAE